MQLEIMPDLSQQWPQHLLIVHACARTPSHMHAGCMHTSNPCMHIWVRPFLYLHMQVWDGRSGQLLRTQAGHKGMVTSLFFSTSARMLFSGSIDNTVGIWTDKGVNLQVWSSHWCAK